MSKCLEVKFLHKLNYHGKEPKTGQAGFEPHVSLSADHSFLVVRARAPGFLKFLVAIPDLAKHPLTLQMLLRDEVSEREVARRDRECVAAARAALVHQRVHQPGEKVALLLSEEQ